jgi:hypothetical protein
LIIHNISISIYFQQLPVCFDNTWSLFLRLFLLGGQKVNANQSKTVPVYQAQPVLHARSMFSDLNHLIDLE